MARAARKKAEEPAKNADTIALETMRKRYRTASDAVISLYDMARNDVKFIDVPGNQWDETGRRRRGKKTCYEFPKLRGQVVGVINEQRASRPQGKVRGVGEGDSGLAEIMQGICRNIESTSNAPQAYDIGYDYAVKGGFGCWRVTTDYANQDDFDLDIFVRPIRNPLCVKFDPAAVALDRRDSRYVFIEELVPKSDHEAEYPDSDLSDFFDDAGLVDWCEKDQIRRAEYWYKKPAKRELWQLSTGAQVYSDEAGLTEEELTAAGITIDKRRLVDGHKVCMRLTNGAEWLSEEVEFPSKFIPIVPVWGNIQNIDGADYWCGMVRPAKDEQRLHNTMRTGAMESAAKATKAPYILKPKWIKGFENYWNNANAEDYPYLPVADDTPDGMLPQRTGQAEMPVALIQLGNMLNEDMKSATGQFDASLGQRSNETSGKAIGMRRAQGANATFNYSDNLNYSIQYTYEILVDMIPRVIDTPRIVRLIGQDGVEKWKKLYDEVPDPKDPTKTIRINDISKGKYDVTVTTGPSYATQRMEAVDTYTQLVSQVGSAYPALAPILAYQVVKNLDMPGGDEVEQWLRKGMVAQGIIPPKEGEEGPQQQPMDPRIEAQIKKLMADAGYSEAKAAKTAAEAQAVLPEADANIQKLVAETLSTQLKNMAASGQLAAIVKAAHEAPPPMQVSMMSPQIQPPQGGFLMPGQGA